MSSEAQRKAGYPLPPDEWEDQTQSFCVTIPAGQAWEMAFRAQLYELGKWWMWKRDPSRPKAASDTATNWRDILEIVEDCGMEDIRVVGCMLQKLEGGVWINVADLTLCGGGGGGFASFGGSTENVPLASNVTITSGTFTRITAGAWTRAFTKSKALVQLVVSAVNSAGQQVIVRPHIQQGATSLNGTNLTQGMTNGTQQREVVVTDFFTNIAAEDATLEIEWRVGGGTGTILANYDVQWTVLEFENLEELFQQDTRYEGGVIQKKIGNVWTDVVDLLALINPIAITANQALSLANNAVNTNNTQQTQINNIIAVNSAQQIVLNNHENRLDSIEDVDIPQINLTLQNHETRIEALEAAASGNSWAGYKFGQITHTQASPFFGYTSPNNVWQMGAITGWLPDLNNRVEIYLTNGMRWGSIVHVRVIVQILGGGLNLFNASVNDGEQGTLTQSPSSGEIAYIWMNVTPRPDLNNAMKIVVENVLPNPNWVVIGATHLYLVINPLTGELLP
jgi:hypothetical protein